MTPVAFLRTQAARALLAQASRAAATPVSVHFLRGEEESPRTISFGRCDACRTVNRDPRARAACRTSRHGPSERALAGERPVPFVCHMGFSCVTVPAFPGV